MYIPNVKHILKAIEYIEKAIITDPIDTGVREYTAEEIAALYNQTRNCKEALELMKKAVGLN